MIQNDRQYRVSKTQAQKFEQALAEMRESSITSQAENPLLWQVQIAAMESQLTDLREEIVSYEASREILGSQFLPEEVVAEVVAMQTSLIENGTPKFAVFLTTLRVTIEIIFSLWFISIENIFSDSANKKPRNKY
jgi:hypothetical protein